MMTENIKFYLRKQTKGIQIISIEVLSGFYVSFSDGRILSLKM
jgi:hypothetical protein